jgi:hypothetical protein
MSVSEFNHWGPPQQVPYAHAAEHTAHTVVQVTRARGQGCGSDQGPLRRLFSTRLPTALLSLD